MLILFFIIKWLFTFFHSSALCSPHLYVPQFMRSTQSRWLGFIFGEDSRFKALQHVDPFLLFLFKRLPFIKE